MDKFVVIFQAPVPVGHRVELVWYEIEVSGLFGASRKPRPHEPVVTDLDTGVVYVSDRVLETPGMKAPDEPLAVSDGLARVAKPVRRVRGIVRACRVVTIRSFSDIDVQTELTIAPEG
ncbi:hypothetical protein [Nannocystis punicea]|uniref:Uncharacterized protein n=1 Tax=Nannocystis punicea TaxID=2995304 RepID=A0ABY7HAC4_9BACT|nr:hypothetical protein [Nannocystis poenicansa]WAS96216.1 hypothetical protein O0S08_08635 [Nannocystis poenicansa]